MGGVLFAAWGYVHEQDVPPYYFSVVEDALGFTVPLLFAGGLAGLYVRCAGVVGRFGMIGFALGLLGSGLGVVNRIEGVHTSMWAYVVGTRGWSPMLLIWLTWILAGLMLFGTATMRGKAFEDWRALPLAMGLLGWIYYFTDAGSLVEARMVHVAFGALFSLSWVVLGYALRLGADAVGGATRRAR